MKKQIKKMIKKIFDMKGKPELGKRIVRLLTAPLGFVFRKFEEEMDKKSGDVFLKLFNVVRNILTDLEVSRYKHQYRKIEEVSQSYCYDEENKQMFEGPDKQKNADEKFAEDVKQINSKMKPILDGLTSSIEEHTELLDGYKSVDVGAGEGQEGKIEDKIERVVYVCSLVFDPRVANVWTSDMIDALITSVMTEFTVAMTPKKADDGKEGSKKRSTAELAHNSSHICNMEPAQLNTPALKAEAHLSCNGLTTRARFKATMKALSSEKSVSLDALKEEHEKKVETFKEECWENVQKAKCHSFHHNLKELRVKIKAGSSTMMSMMMGGDDKLKKKETAMMADMKKLKCPSEKAMEEELRAKAQSLLEIDEDKERTFDL